MEKKSWLFQKVFSFLASKMIDVRNKDYTVGCEIKFAYAHLNVCDVRSHFSTLLRTFCGKNGHKLPKIAISLSFLGFFKLINATLLLKLHSVEMQHQKI